ncbi:MAG: pyruvate formate lyase family protein [Promethearchaeota archaeon]
MTESERRRTIALKEELLSCKYELCVERIRYYTQVYKEHDKEPEVIKRALALAHTLKHMTIFIRDDELLVGNETSKNLGEKINLDLLRYQNNFNKKKTFKKFERRKLQPFYINEEDVEELLEIAPFWNGKALMADKINSRLLDEGFIASEDTIPSLAPNISIQIGTTEGHVCANYAKLLKLGYRGILKEAENYQLKLNKSHTDYKKKNEFYRAVKIYYQAAIDFSKRFALLTKAKSQTTVSESRKQELLHISKMMDNLCVSPPSSFYEAVQLIWFSQNIANIIYQRSVVALGRLDQILWSFYEKDLNSGKITRDFALDLIEELNLKLTWNVTLLPTDFTMVANAIGQNTQTITISGIDKDGNDATNDLSYLFLQAYKNIKVFTTDLSIRIHANTPNKFLLEAIKVFRSTSGIAFYNDEIIIPSLIKTGYSLEDARDYVLIGCVEPTGQGNNFAATGRMFMNLPGVLELVLNNGYCHLTKRIGGLQTGELKNFSTFETFYDAFYRQLQFNIKKVVEIAKIGDEEANKYFHHPFISAMITGCMENGKDHVCGGAKYNFSSITAYGFATLIDSLFNIKKLVYEQNLINLQDLEIILSNNFMDEEALRLKLINKFQKWGNDEKEIDEFAAKIWDLFTSEVSKYAPIRGGRYNAGAYSMGIHVMEGLFTQPTADGRKALEPISNSLSPVNNAVKNGITAILNSIAKLNYDKATNGVAVNVRIHPQNLNSEENLEKLCSLLKGYFKAGGMQLQPTVVSTETLRDAQIHPDNYKDLIVKVGGYNATFVDLGRLIQNDIIDRFEHSEI